MNWISILLSGISGGLSVLIARFFIEQRKERRIAYAIVFAISFFSLQAISKSFILPKINIWYNLRTIKDDLQHNEVFATIKKYEPDTYLEIERELQAAVSQGESNSKIIMVVRSNIAKIASKKMPTSSNNAVIKYTRAMVAEINELNAVSPDYCFSFLFPSISAPQQDYSKYFSKKTRDADLDGLNEVIISSIKTPQPIPAEDSATNLLKKIYSEMEKNGKDMSALSLPDTRNENRRQACILASEFYGRILSRPGSESGIMLRYLFSRK